MTTTEPARRTHERIDIRPASGALGAEISGIDLSRPLDDDVFAEIQQAFHDHLVIFFRDQTLDPADQVAFTERFGPTEPHPLGMSGLDDHPQVMVLENRPGKLGLRNDFWHSDISFAEKPPALSILYSIKATEGRADTMFCNMYAAYEELSERLRTILDGLDGVHDADQLVNEVPSRVQAREVPPGVVHPVVRTHPGSDRRALFVNPYYTSHFVGMTREESQPLLEYLYARATRHENIYRHKWRVGDVLIPPGCPRIAFQLRSADAARELAKTFGAEMKDIYLTMGEYDLVITMEAPNDDAVAKFALAVGATGNVRSTTLKAFTEKEYRGIIDALP